MLVLSRKTNETVIVGDVIFTILDVSDGRVRVGIEAPKTTPIKRGELDDRVRDELHRGPT